jgi:malonate-semialdehyde dehydrogenase (acetylating)/methylmalonate-semialdehyde dehydrogenase
MSVEPQVASNYIDGSWQTAGGAESLPVMDPGTGETLGRVPLSPPEQVDRAAVAAHAALPGWGETPPGERIQPLFRLKALMEAEFEALAQIITRENGKTLAESRGELKRAIENIEVACGIPSLIQGGMVENIAPGIDEFVVRQPVGVCAVISPFNFPGMIPFWFMPYALACGNCCIVKPSEKVPLTMARLFKLIDAAGFPKGVVNLVNGAASTVEALLDHPAVRAVSFVGSTPVARAVYSRATANGKRVQAQGGAKNPIVVLPDADLEMATRIASDSAFGNAGQRCLAASLAIVVGEARQSFVPSMVAAAESRRVGYGLDEGVEMGPVITPQSKTRIEGLIGRGEQEGARILVDGRHANVPGYPGGNYLRPTVLEDLPPAGELAQTEIFGPVLGLIHTDTLEGAIQLVNSGRHGNMACLFTSSGAAARRFRHSVQAGNVGINIGVAAPMAYFPFSGWKESFFGDLHGQAGDAVAFFTQSKVVIERWPAYWSRKF